MARFFYIKFDIQTGMYFAMEYYSDVPIAWNVCKSECKRLAQQFGYKWIE